MKRFRNQRYETLARRPMKAVSKLARHRTTDAMTLTRILLPERLEQELKSGVIDRLQETNGRTSRFGNSGNVDHRYMRQAFEGNAPRSQAGR
jgi:hypothetical protein